MVARSVDFDFGGGDEGVLTSGWTMAGERIEARRYAAVLILRELTKVAPAFVYDHVAVLLDNLWTALRDPKVMISVPSFRPGSETDERPSLNVGRLRFERQQRML